MKVLHLSTTPLVGAPGEICKALREHSNIDARWGVHQATAGAYSKMAFDLDLTWDKDREEIVRLAEECDVLHLHNFIDLDSKMFAPIDIRGRWKASRAIVRHFHSTPALIASFMGTTEDDVLQCPIPKLCIAQYPERFYRNARTVPNIVSQAVSRPVRAAAGVRIGYAPSRFNPARSSRWDTKGYPETVKVLRRVESKARRLGLAVSVDIIEQVNHTECLTRKSLCNIIVDDLVTGSYHLNTLESLVAGSAVLTYLDRRTQQALNDLTGRADFPITNVGLENAEDVLLYLCSHPSIVEDLGLRASQWMAHHWAPRAMAMHFINAYNAVIENPHRVFPARIDNSLAAQWDCIGSHDILWRSRSQYWPRESPSWWLKMRSSVGHAMRRAKLRS